MVNLKVYRAGLGQYNSDGRMCIWYIFDKPFYLMLIAADAFLYIRFHFLLLLWQLDGVR